MNEVQNVAQEKEQERVSITQYMKRRHKKTKAILEVVGCLAAIKFEGKVFIGWTKYAKSRESSKYSKDFSRKLAIHKAVVQGQNNRKYDFNELPFAVRPFIPEFIARAEKYYKAKVANVKGMPVVADVEVPAEVAAEKQV